MSTPFIALLALLIGICLGAGLLAVIMKVTKASRDKRIEEHYEAIIEKLSERYIELEKEE